MSKVSRKLNRYRRLIKIFSNWPQFLFFKMYPGRNDSFEFHLRNAFKITVPRNMLGPFRECFLDEVYLKNIDPSLLHKENPTIIDIGSNVGYFSLYMFYKFPKAKIYAFEPLPYCFNTIKTYQSQYKQFNWQVYQDAVSDTETTIEIYTDSPDGFSTTSSMFMTDKAYKIEVNTTTLPGFIAANGIEHIDFLKLDCEGAEYPILYNLPDSVWKKTSCLSMEAHALKGEKENIFALVDFLKTKKYRVVFREKDRGGHLWASGSAEVRSMK
jgi:FkbM family methyltransferase